MESPKNEVIHKNPPPPFKPPVDAFEVLVRDCMTHNLPGEQFASAVKAFFHERYTNAVVVNATYEISLLDITIKASNLLLNHVCALVNPSGVTIVIVLKQFDEYVFPRIHLFSRKSDLLTVHQVAKLLTWISKYQDRVAQLYPEMLFPREHLDYMEELSKEYIRRGVHDPLQQMIQRSLEMNDSNGIDRSNDGHFFTQLPMDVAVFLNSQLSTAKTALPRQCFAEVAKACQEELFNMVGGIMLLVETRWQDLSVEHLCSIAVDSQRLVEIVDGIFGSVNTTDKQDDLTEELICELTQLSVLATRFLCELRFLDLKETYLNLVGGDEWESGNLSVLDPVSELRDFVIDVGAWIPGDFYRGKVLKYCFDNFIQSYVSAFLSNTMAKGVYNSEKVAQILHYDFFKMADFFGVELSEQHGHYGFYTRDLIESRLEVLDSFAAILECCSPKAIEREIEVACQQIGFDKGVPVILHIAGLRDVTNTMTVKESNEWHVQIWRAGEKLKMQLIEEGSYYQVPDMRNSRFLRRVKPLKHKSSTETEAVLSTRLCQRSRVAKIVSRSKRMIGTDRKLLTTWKKGGIDS
jgi:hypothetical protein